MLVQLHCLKLCNATRIGLVFDFVAQPWDTWQLSSIERQQWERLMCSDCIVTSLPFFGRLFASISLSCLSAFFFSGWSSGHITPPQMNSTASHLGQPEPSPRLGSRGSHVEVLWVYRALPCSHLRKHVLQNQCAYWHTGCLCLTDDTSTSPEPLEAFHHLVWNPQFLSENKDERRRESKLTPKRADSRGDIA